MLQGLIFLSVVLLVVTLIHYYLWRRLVRDTTTGPGRWRRAGTIAVIAAVVAVLAALIGSRALPRSVGTVLAWPGYLWLAVMFYLLVMLLVLEVPTLIVKALLRLRAEQSKVDAAAALISVPAGASAEESLTVPAVARPAPPESLTAPPAEPPAPRVELPDPDVDESRRRLLARGVAITAGLVAVGVTASGIRTALGPPELKRVQIPLAKLPRSADGLRIALVSDIHLGPLRGYSHSRRVVDMINGMDADVVAVVGDLVDDSVETLSDAVAPLRELRSRYGSYFVTGNHEYFSGVDEWIEKVAGLGLRPLRNEHLTLPTGVDLVGVEDLTGEAYGSGPDFDKALAGRDPNRPSVLLAHQPVQAAEAARRGMGLQLAGHTHGGQIYPFHYLVKLQQPVVTGLAEVDGMPVYVTNGAGFWGPPVRVGARPDITLVTLRSP